MIYGQKVNSIANSHSFPRKSLRHYELLSPVHLTRVQTVSNVLGYTEPTFGLMFLQRSLKIDLSEHSHIANAKKKFWWRKPYSEIPLNWRTQEVGWQSINVDVFCQLESFRFWDEDDYEYEIFSILSIADAWTSVILAGIVIVVVILPRVLARISQWWEQLMKCKTF